MSIYSLIGGLFGNYMNYISNSNNNQSNIDVMRMQNAFNSHMQDKQNAYNDPSAQMARLAKAGINPALAYSNGISNTATSLPQSTGNIAMQPFINDFSDIGNKISLDAQRNQEIDESTSRVKLNGANTLLVNKQTLLTGEEINKVKQECNVLGEQVNLIIAQADNLRSDTSLKKWQHDFNKRTENEQVQKLANEVGLSANELSYLAATLQERITGVQLLNTKQRQEIAKLRKENAKYNDYYDAMISAIQANANKTGVEFNLLDTYGDMEHAIGIISDAFEILNSLGLSDVTKPFLKALGNKIKRNSFRPVDAYSNKK